MSEFHYYEVNLKWTPNQAKWEATIPGGYKATLEKDPAENYWVLYLTAGRHEKHWLLGKPHDTTLEQAKELAYQTLVHEIVSQKRRVDEAWAALTKPVEDEDD